MWGVMIWTGCMATGGHSEAVVMGCVSPSACSGGWLCPICNICVYSLQAGVSAAALTCFDGLL